MSAREGWSLRRRLGQVVAGVAALLLLLGTVGTLAVTRLLAEQHRIVDELTPSLLAAQQLEAAAIDQETGLRGYALSHEDSFLEPYRRGVAGAERTAVAVREHTAGEPELRASFDRVEAALTAWHDGYAEPTLARLRADATPELPYGDGKRLFDAIRAAYAEFAGRVTAARSDAVAALNRDTTTAIVVLALTGAAVVALTVLMGLALRRLVVRPVVDVADQARVVADGNLRAPVRGSGPAELVALGRDVEAMRLALVRSLGEAEDQAAALARSNRDLEQFAYVASHDLQEPLRKVASFCQLLERRYAGQLDERADQYIAFAVDGAKRMQALINDLLAFSRVGRTTESFTRVALTDALDTARAALATLLAETGATVTASGLPEVEGDPVLLAQLLQNLVSNAVKFRRDGVAPRVRVSGRLVEQGEGVEWELSCSDNGIGIEPQYAEKIFVIFQRLHAKEAYAGTGIGLALCKRIVEFHGGRIWLDTTVTEGTSFRWTLPVIADPGPDGSPGSAAAGRAAGDPLRLPTDLALQETPR